MSAKFIWREGIMGSFLEEVMCKLSPDERMAR